MEEILNNLVFNCSFNIRNYFTPTVEFLHLLQLYLLWVTFWKFLLIINDPNSISTSKNISSNKKTEKKNKKTQQGKSAYFSLFKSLPERTKKTPTNQPNNNNKGRSWGKLLEHNLFCFSCHSVLHSLLAVDLLASVITAVQLNKNMGIGWRQFPFFFKLFCVFLTKRLACLSVSLQGLVVISVYTP